MEGFGVILLEISEKFEFEAKLKIKTDVALCHVMDGLGWINGSLDGVK